MTKFFLLSLIMVSLCGYAQPTDPDYLEFRDPCHLPPDSSIDLNFDNIPDLIIGSTMVGTEDEPSSGGNCSRIIRPATGTFFLNATDYRGSPLLIYAKNGDRFNVTDIELDVRQYKKSWQSSDAITMISWGYGSWFSEAAAYHNTTDYIIFKTITSDRILYGWFMPAADAATGEIWIDAYEMNADTLITPGK